MTINTDLQSGRSRIIMNHDPLRDSLKLRSSPVRANITWGRAVNG